MAGEAPIKREVAFVEGLVPALEAGEYVISVQQQLDATSTGLGETIADTWSGSRRIAVAGERFTLGPSAVQSPFPPANKQGEYAETLPHLTLASPTLPWQRSADAAGKDPWLALLLFEAGDPAPATQTIKVGDLQREPFVREAGGSPQPSELPATAASYPDGYKALGLEFAVEYGQSLSDPCLAIDVPVDLFAAIAPSAADLAWLTHARRVEVDAKPGSPPDTYSVAVGNRPAAGGSPCTVHLVSLEGMSAFLPAAGSYAPAPIKLASGEAAELLRLVSLYSWSFTPTDPKQSFSSYLTGLNCGALQRPHGNATSGPAGAVDTAFGLGYTALDHHTRQGDATVSWYRGPLVPFEPPAVTTIPSPVDSADELMRYEPESGMLDASYAAAWQLGRLLGLQSKAFSVALYNWRRGVARAAARAPGGIAELDAETDPPAEVSRWLDRLRQLHGVPFNYLVADEGLLPVDSIRFFQLDRNWVDALLEGALSIGRSTSTDRDQDTVLLPKLRDDPLLGAPVSGFLLRSAVVADWPGLEVSAYDGSEEPLTAPHLERLAPTVLLFMATGSIARVDVHEPAEALHFGFEPGGTKKQLRYVTVPANAPPKTEPGSTFEPGAGVTVTARDKGAIEVEALAQQLEAALRTAHANDDAQGNPRPFTAAEFALQMVEGAEAVNFVNQPPVPA